MTEKRWKAQERRVARALNAKRNPRDGTPGPDVENLLLVAEVRDRKTIPDWLLANLAVAREHAGGKRLAMLVLTTSSSTQAFVIMDLDDYRDWHVGIPKAERRR